MARLAALAGRLGLDGDVLAGFVADGGRLSFVPVSSGLGSDLTASAVAALGNARMPMTEDGFPDFDAVLAVGRTVTGVLAPGRFDHLPQVASDLGIVVTYTAIVALGDGTPPFLVKGRDANAAATGVGVSGRTCWASSSGSSTGRPTIWSRRGCGRT